LVKNFYAQQKEGHTLEVIDPRDLDLPVLKQALHFYRDPSKAPKILKEVNKKIEDADAYLLITSEYNHGVPPALSNTLNHFPPTSYYFKVSGIIGYTMGPSGGLNGISSLRTFLAELGCLPVSHTVSIPKVMMEITPDGKTENPHIISSLTKSYKQLEWYARALKFMRTTEGIPQGTTNTYRP